MMRLTQNDEHAHAIASAISDLVSAQNSHYVDRDRVIAGAYKELVESIASALALKADIPPAGPLVTAKMSENGVG